MANFNPLEFFEKTAQFASQGRGRFQCDLGANHFFGSTVFPEDIAPAGVVFSASNEDARITLGRKLLSEGLVAKNVSLPSVQLNTYEPFSYMGPTRKVPYGMQFSDLTVEFYLMGRTIEEAGSLHYFFYKWMEGISGPRDLRDDEMPYSDSTVFDVAYYDSYIADAKIEWFSPHNDSRAVITNKFSELFPIEVSGLQYSWESQDTPVTMSVTFAYHYSRVIPT